MGHERIGFLPHTKQWQALTEQLTSYDGDPETVRLIADQTLKCIKNTYAQMPYDESVTKAVKFLAILSVSATKENQVKFLRENGYSVDKNISVFSLLSSAQRLINTENGSLEINKIAKDSVMQAVMVYSLQHQNNQISFFTDTEESIWAKSGTGAAFCEMSRAFFASFTDRQLKYYIERSAASSINDYSTLQSFIEGVKEQSDVIADHAFETSKIMQSFAAGWFNKYAGRNIPTDANITSFLQMSFGKMREEFRREAEGI